MKLFIKGSGQEIHIDNRHFIAKGGEGSIFGKGDTAYKIYDDAAKMIPLQKIEELSVLSNPNIVRPQSILLDANNNPIGYTMRLLKETHPLVSLFAKSFKQRNQISAKNIIDLVQKLQTLIAYVHSKKGILIVDLNELNFLTDSHFKEMYGIDTNSYQTPSFPATVIMDSIRDRHCNNKFNQNTDWFSFGIIAFQMLIGIHPYKGNHPDFENTPKDERLNARMLKNISVLHKGTTFPKICEPFDVIPPALRKWFNYIFEEGGRIAPPNDYEIITNIIPALVKEITGTNLFDISEMFKFDEEISRICSNGTAMLVIGQRSIFLRQKQFPLPHTKCKIGFEPKKDIPVVFWLESGQVKALDLIRQQEVPLSLSADSLMENNGRVYVKLDQSILELSIQEIGASLKVFAKPVGKVLDVPGATYVLDGFILQNMLGTFHASFFPTSGQCYQIKIPELTKYKIIDAKYQNQVLIVIGAKKGQYDRLVFRFTTEFKYDVRIVEKIDYSGINMAVNSSGICVLLNEEEKIEVFANTMGSKIKVMDDPLLDVNLRLAAHGGKIVFSKKNKIYSFSMKP